MLEDLRKQAADLGVGGRVFWLGFRADAKELLPGLDVLAMPSLYEGLPMVLLEAMAAGTPVVAHAVSGIPEVITHGTNGFLTKVGDVEDFAGRIASLLSDPAAAYRIGAEARARVMESYSVETMARRTAALYDQVIDQKR
ncbi:hypothetical protein CCAX7_001890 [Capsulimonas corticalis]|uniref:Uncharacterized protein n=1 Tax=Capsulimonas corticalis TaxID=2219043 RepID=A0A402CRW7_9BACT|nr:hypothetical protein CCAX7_001890 [Capsulimonas corticalis]